MLGSTFCVEKISDGIGDVPFLFGVIRLHDWPPSISHLSLRRSTQPRRTRNPSLLVVTAALPGEKPAKSVSTNPKRSKPPTCASKRAPSREFCAVKRNSDKCPATVFENAMLP